MRGDGKSARMISSHPPLNCGLIYIASISEKQSVSHHRQDQQHVQGDEKEGREERCEFEKERLSVKTSKAKFCPPATNTKRLQQMS